MRWRLTRARSRAPAPARADVDRADADDARDGRVACVSPPGVRRDVRTTVPSRTRARATLTTRTAQSAHRRAPRRAVDDARERRRDDASDRRRGWSSRETSTSVVMRPDDAARVEDVDTRRAVEVVKAKMKIIDDGVEAARALKRMAEETRTRVEELSSMFARRKDDPETAGLSELEKLLRDAREASEPGARATRAIETLERDKTKLFATWETLTTLDVDLCAIRAALARVGQRKRGVFDDEEFERVDAAWMTFEAIMWNSVRQSILAGEPGSQDLVRAVRVVAEQEVLDEEFECDAVAFEPEIDVVTNKVINVAPPEPKRWKTKVFAELSSAVEARLALIAEGFTGLDEKESIEHVLSALDKSLVSLADMYDYTIPAFPPEWRVFDVVVAPTFHSGICDLLVRLSSSESTSNGDMVATVEWSEHYFNAIQSLGLDIETTDDVEQNDSEPLETVNETETPPLPFPVGLSTVIETYCDRLRVTVSNWMHNLCRIAVSRPPKEDGSGKIWTPSDMEFFRLVADQMVIAINTRSSVFVRQCGGVAAEMIGDYASALAERLGMSVMVSPARPHSRSGRETTSYDAPEVPFETLVAGVNDTRRCQNLALQTQKTVLDALGAKDEVLARKFEVVAQSFAKIHADARVMISHRVFEDPGLAAVFKTFYAPNPDGQWAQGESMITLLATVEDYLDDIETWLSADVSGSVMETLFEHLIELLFDVFTRHVSAVAPHTASRLEADENALLESMTIRMGENKALGRIARLRNLRALVSAADSDAFVREYGLLLGNWPEAGLDVVAAILRARRDMDKSTTRALIDRCRDVCITKLAAITGQRPSVGFSSASAFASPRVSAPSSRGHRRLASDLNFASFNARFRDFA